ncbi:ORF240 [White spot syndrome virus]|uniref:ORF240 n=1 Tax=White spot syndrome virus TaxID=342409 RepID=A0A2D3I5I7_9VIRU|nr:ORF240 [White spot syndrome virus]
MNVIFRLVCRDFVYSSSWIFLLLSLGTNSFVFNSSKKSCTLSSFANVTFPSCPRFITSLFLNRRAESCIRDISSNFLGSSWMSFFLFPEEIKDPITFSMQ